jgi:aerobic-type carbon monoxide dehydrogenase small subunit (CoxS/CutS family)
LAKIAIRINGKLFQEDIPERMLLVDFIRENANLTVKSCMLLAAQADGHDITTVEGLAQGGELTPLQEAFKSEHGLQCGFCTAGILMNMTDFLKQHPDPSEQEIRESLIGNLCRCTGYVHIVNAVLKVVQENQLKKA